MSDLDIFVKTPEWNNLIITLSGMLGMTGIEENDERGIRYVWSLFGLDIVAIAEPSLEDDQGIPFSTFSSEIALILRRTEHEQAAETFRHAFAVLLVLHLRSVFGPEVCLIQNLQREIEI